MRATCRLTGAAKKTVERLLVLAGEACLKFHNEKVINLKSELIQVDEIWSFTYAKQKNVPFTKRKDQTGVGDTWTWTAFDSDSKLLIAWRVGNRDSADAYFFIHDLKQRLANRVQLTSDGHKAYLEAVEDAFGSDIDYAQLIKLYGMPYNPNAIPTMEARYSPPVCTGARKHVICGSPVKELISTSHMERQNLNMRMEMRRFTRLTNAFSKKIENHAHMVAIHTVYHNFCRIHKTLRCTPAMEAGISDRLFTLEDMANLIVDSK